MCAWKRMFVLILGCGADLGMFGLWCTNTDAALILRAGHVGTTVHGYKMCCCHRCCCRRVVVVVVVFGLLGIVGWVLKFDDSCYY